MGLSRSLRDFRYLTVLTILLGALLLTFYDLDLLARARCSQSSSILGPGTPSYDGSNDTSTEKLGYVTWLGKTGNGADQEDVYFIATRILVYQILHSPATKSPRGLPIIVMTTPDVAPANRKRLEDDGATVVPIEFVEEGMDWLKPRRATWAKIMSKLRAWELTEYSRLLMLDGDIILRRPLDAVFDEINTTFATPLPEVVAPRKSDEAPLPLQYVFAGGPEVNGIEHHWPPSRAQNDFIHPDTCNLGFVLLSPSRELFDHYISILKIKNRFSSATMEQSLLNYAHRLDGPMPRRFIPPTWNIRSPNEADILGDVASLHDKWWRTTGGYPALGKWYKSVKVEMEEFYKKRDQEMRA